MMRQAKNISMEQFPILCAGLSEERVERVANVFNVINENVLAGKIANPVFQDVKEVLNRLVDSRWNSYVSAPFFHGSAGRLAEDVQSLYWDVRVHGLHECKSAIKKVTASKATGPEIAAMRAFLAEVEPLSVAMDSLKAVVFKRQPKSPEEAELSKRFVPPPSSNGATEKVRQLLVDITTRHHDALVAWFQAKYTGQISEFMSADGKAKSQMIRDPFIRRVVVCCTNFDRKRSGDPYLINPDSANVIKLMAEEDAKELQDSFVYKNIVKLSSIIEQKGDLRQAEILDGSVNLSGLTGTIRFLFDDDSKFTIQNSVVWSRSVNNNWFARFPLTFHDVVMPGGERMKLPSEEKMNALFKSAQKARKVSIDLSTLKDITGADFLDLAADWYRSEKPDRAVDVQIFSDKYKVTLLQRRADNSVMGASLYDFAVSGYRREAGSEVKALQRIKDFLSDSFDEVLSKYSEVDRTRGQYFGVMRCLQKNLPVVVGNGVEVAGKHDVNDATGEAAYVVRASAAGYSLLRELQADFESKIHFRPGDSGKTALDQMAPDQLKTEIAYYDWEIASRTDFQSSTTAADDFIRARQDALALTGGSKGVAKTVEVTTPSFCI